MARVPLPGSLTLTLTLTKVLGNCLLWRECLYREPALRFIRDVVQVNPNPV